jgi:hypothetical protein
MYQADSWDQPRQVVIKCEAHAQQAYRRGPPKRRCPASYRPRCLVNPTAVYDEYAERGGSEHRNKELKRELAADRLSDHRILANFFRLYLPVATLILLFQLR